jgi:protein ImuA
MGEMTEIMVQQSGSGELRLLAPALVKVANRKIVLIDPPHPPHAIALAGLGIDAGNVLWIKSKVGADALWAAQTVLKSNACSVLMWTSHIRQESLRRLHLAAQSGENLFWMFRPLAAAQDASPSPLRLTIRPAPNGIEVGFVKRKGPARAEPLFLPLAAPGGAPIRPNHSIHDQPVRVPAPRVSDVTIAQL